MILRNYQQAAIVKMRQSIAKGNKRIVMYLATGGGKSLIAAEVIRLALDKEKRVAFLVNRKALVHQFSRTLDKLGIRHDVAQGENTFITGKKVLVATVQTVARRGLFDIDMILIDEGHAVPGSKEYRDLLFKFSDKIVVAITATPFSKGMAKPYPELDGPLFQDLIVVSTIKDLIKQGFLVDCDIFSPSEPDLKGIKLQKNSFGEMDYSEKELGKAVDKPDLIGDIVNHWIRLGKDKQTVVFATNISHSRHIVEQFKAQGIKAEHIDGYMLDEERDGIAKRFERGETTVISNVAVLREGWDVPACEVMILARPTRSLTTWIQMAGRVLRPSEGKGRALILDHSGSSLNLGYPTSDLPLELCDGSKKSSDGNKKPKEKKESKCEKCSFVKLTFACGNCGHVPTIQHGVVHADGELKKMEKKKEYSVSEKQEIWSSALGLAAMRGRQKGWASHLYRSMTGVWPKGLVDAACHPSEKVMNMATRNAIAYAKGRDSHAR